MFEYKVLEVVKVVDGDTVDLKLDLGFHLTIVERFRLAYIDTPERGEKGYHEATNRLTELLSNKTIIAKTGKEQGSFKRWLIELFIENDNISINHKLLDEGLAKLYV